MKAVCAGVVTAYEDKNSFVNRYDQSKNPFYGILEIDVTPNTLFTFGADTQRTLTRGGMFGGLPLFNSAGGRTNYAQSATTASDWASAETRTQTLFSSLQHNFDNGWNIKGTFTFDNDKLRQDVMWPTGYPDPQTNIGMRPGSLSLIDGARRQQNYDIQVNGQYSLLAANISWVWAGIVNDKILITTIIWRPVMPPEPVPTLGISPSRAGNILSLFGVINGLMVRKGAAINPRSMW